MGQCKRCSKGPRCPTIACDRDMQSVARTVLTLHHLAYSIGEMVFFLAWAAEQHHRRSNLFDDPCYSIGRVRIDLVDSSPTQNPTQISPPDLLSGTPCVLSLLGCCKVQRSKVVGHLGYVVDGLEIRAAADLTSDLSRPLERGHMLK